jgi:lipoate-protein ligase A
LENDDLLTAYEATRQPQFRVYEPPRRVIVLGAAGNADADVYGEQAAAAGIEIRRRRGGGGTVLLGPGQVVVALVTEVDHPYRNREYAHAINDWLIDALHGDGVRGIEQRGISDLAIAGRKIAGTSVFRRRRILFYQASLLVDNDPSEFERFLAFPRQVPVYRRGRGHAAFCTTLAAAGYRYRAEQVAALLQATVAARIGGLR